ncbi:MAG: hypothetical protein EOM83_14710 [Clostridia bacterium]|nr:hypothetical protein [Clostridia bacterium]
MITYNLLEDNYLIENFSGSLNAGEFIRMKQNQIDDTDYGRIRGIVMDLRKMKITFTKEKLDQFFAWLVRNKAIIENKSVAILTKTMEQLNFGYRLSELFSENLMTARVEQFSSKKEAYLWLTDNRANGR